MEILKKIGKHVGYFTVGFIALVATTIFFMLVSFWKIFAVVFVIGLCYFLGYMMVDTWKISKSLKNQ
jgi:uncharacterized membrane protein